jgi:hypothetical protein
MDQFNLLYTCENLLCKALYCRVCIEQWLVTDSCPKVCALCKCATVLAIAQNTNSIPADITITLTSVEHSQSLCQSTSDPKVIAIQLFLHLLIHMVFMFRLSAKQVIPKASTTLLVIYCVLVCSHLLWLIAIRTQYCQRRYLLALLSMTAPVGLMLYRLGIVTAVLPGFEVVMISLLSVFACMIDIATCWTFQ